MKNGSSRSIDALAACPIEPERDQEAYHREAGESEDRGARRLGDAREKHGIFTRCFLDALERERNGMSTVRLTVLYEEIAAAVSLKTNGAQEPIATFIPLKKAALPILPRVARQP